MNDGNNRVLVLADDFTGANDAGVSPAEAGMSVEVAFTAGQPSTARALILNSDSRAMTAAAAADKVAALLRGAATFVPHWQVKKIDSTLRGNPGGELEAMMAAQGCRMAVVAPAYPAAGRHTRDGRCYVHGVPLDQTEFASDPKTPVSRAEISEIIAMQSRLPCLTLNAGQLPAALATAGEKKRVLIVDARKTAIWTSDRRRCAPCAGDPAGRLGGSLRGAGSPPAPQRAGPAAGGGRFDERDGAASGCCAAGPFPSTGD